MLSVFGIYTVPICNVTDNRKDPSQVAGIFYQSLTYRPDHQLPVFHTNGKRRICSASRLLEPEFQHRRHRAGSGLDKHGDENRYLNNFKYGYLYEK